MRKLSVALIAALVAGLGSFTPAFAPTAQGATQPKVAIIVGPTQSVTASYRSNANDLYEEAIKYTSNVVRVYSPNATWSKVKSAVDGASIVIYLGHGNGWPSPYTFDPNYTTKNGFGLNYDNNGDGKLSDDENKYYGEPSIRTLTPAPNAVVLLFHLCYASGSSEPGDAPPTLAVAKQRVDNFAAAFIKAGARAVIASGLTHNPYYISALFTTRQTIEQYWRNAPDANDAFSSYASVRNPGYTFQLDPDGPGKYYRSITGKMSLTTTQVTGSSYSSTAGDPATFVAPGNASTTADGAPVYGSPESAATNTDPATRLPLDAKVRLDEQLGTAWNGAPIFAVHTDDGVEGWMTGDTLRPRDSTAPRVWEEDGGSGVFSPNGDDSQDTWNLTVGLSEASAWTLRVVDGDGDTLDSASGSGQTATMTWAPEPDGVADGTYGWELQASDAWGNGPLTLDGSVRVDTRAPEVSLADADAPTAVTFAPNGDGYRESVGFNVASSEPGTVLGAAIDAAGDTVDWFSGPVAGTTTLTWDGKTADGYLPDGRYTVSIRARDQAGNVSEAQTRIVGLYSALGFLTSSKAVFFPQDNDPLARSTVLGMRLASAATVTWRIVDLKGATVRTLKAAEALEAGTHTLGWDGRDDAGAFVPRGTYRSYVSATNGTQVATQAVSLVADAFRFGLSDATPSRGQRLTVTVTSAESLAALPKVTVYQPGMAGWSATMAKVSAGVYRVTVTMRWSSKGTVRIKVTGVDSGSRSQWSHVYLPLN